MQKSWLRKGSCHSTWLAETNCSSKANFLASIDRLRSESKIIGEEGIVMRVTDIHRELINGPEPSPRQLSSKSVVPEKHICYSLAFRAWQPSRNKSIDLWLVGFNHDRTARDYDHNALNIAADIEDRAWTWFSYGQVQTVSSCLCIRSLSDDDNGIREVVGLDEISIRVPAVDDFCAWIECGWDTT